MAMIQRGGRAWQLLTVAVIAIPWLLRDELATRLDVQATAAAEVQTALHQENDRAAQAGEQRETRDRLKNIEIMVAKVAKASSASDAQDAQAAVVSESAKQEAEDLVTSAEAFLGLLEQIPITPHPVASDDKDRMAAHKEVDAWLGINAIASGGLTQAQLKALGEKVAKTAQDVADSDDPAVGDWTEWNHATHALHVAYTELAASAEAAEASSAAAATAARWAAWLFTALGALMIGDWSRVARGRDADAAAGDSARAAPDARDHRKAA